MAVVPEKEAEEIVRRAEEANSAFWRPHFEKDRRMLWAISAEIAVYGFSPEQRERYVSELNLIGRDFMFVECSGLVKVRYKGGRRTMLDDFTKEYFETKDLLSRIREKINI